jgi:hypothetical protein
MWPTPWCANLGKALPWDFTAEDFYLPIWPRSYARDAHMHVLFAGRWLHCAVISISLDHATYLCLNRSLQRQVSMLEDFLF